jgi:hypothetical protein
LSRQEILTLEEVSSSSAGRQGAGRPNLWHSGGSWRNIRKNAKNKRQKRTPLWFFAPAGLAGAKDGHRLERRFSA